MNENPGGSSASGKQFQRDFIVQLRYKIPATCLFLAYRQHRMENPPDRDCIMDEGIYAQTKCGKANETGIEG